MIPTRLWIKIGERRVAWATDRFDDADDHYRWVKREYADYSPEVVLARAALMLAEARLMRARLKLESAVDAHVTALHS